MSQQVKLKKWYTDPSNPGSFQGVSKVYNSLRKTNRLNFNTKDIKKYLEKDTSYTLNKPAKHTFPRNRVLVEGIDSQLDCDLGDMATLAKENDGYKYIFLAIDIFSRYIWLQPMKTKFAAEIINVFTSIFKGGRKPSLLRTDGGREFQNKSVHAFVTKRGVHLFRTYNTPQANFAERALKTIKQRIYRYIVHKNDVRYVDVLQKIASSYNKTIHSSIGRTPLSVSKKNEDEVRYDEYLRRRAPKNDEDYPYQKLQFAIGDYVRIALRKEALDREYGQKWPGEVFTVATRRRRGSIPLYTLKEWDG